MLNLVDGGLNGENIPFQPLLAEARGVDVIMAMDGSADTDQNYPNGESTPSPVRFSLIVL